MNLGEVAQQHLRRLVAGSSYQVDWSQESPNSIEVELYPTGLFYRLYLPGGKSIQEIQEELVSYLQSRFPKYVIRVESASLQGSTWSFIISYYPEVELPLEIIQKILRDLGTFEIRRLISEDPELKRLLNLDNPYFWYLLVTEKYGQLYPQLYNLRMDLTDWEELLYELDQHRPTFDLEMLTRAVRFGYIEIVKMLLQDPRFYDFANIPPKPRMKSIIKNRVPQVPTGRDQVRHYNFPAANLTLIIPVDSGQFIIRDPVVALYRGGSEILTVVSKEELSE